METAKQSGAVRSAKPIGIADDRNFGDFAVLQHHHGSIMTAVAPSAGAAWRNERGLQKGNRVTIPRVRRKQKYLLVIKRLDIDAILCYPVGRM